MEHDINWYVNSVQSILNNIITGEPDSDCVKRDIIEQYINTWHEAKQEWIKKFGGNTIYTYPTPVTCVMSNEAKRMKIAQFLDRFCPAERYSEDIYTFGYRVFEDFIETQGIKATENLVTSTFELSNGTRIPAGMKLLRAFKYFFKDKDALLNAQNVMNQIISDCKLKGYLHFSVDPLDYLSISENNHGWRSCHSLDGDYAAGNVEYMMDTATVVCYIDDNEQTNISNFPSSIKWNSKKWRMLLFFSSDKTSVIASRQYPSSIEGIFPIIHDIIADFYPEYYYSDWSNAQYINLKDQNDNFLGLYETHLYSAYERVLYPITSIYATTPRETTFYDDILHSSVYKYPYFLFGGNVRTWFTRTQHPIKVGVGGVTCPRCGHHKLIPSENWYCEEDEDDGRYVCECCGRHRCREDEGRWLGNDQWWCDDCIEQYAAQCHCCGEWYNTEDMFYSERLEDYLCEDCHDQEVDYEWQ